MSMHDPAHPGEVIRKLCIQPLGLTVTEAAKALGVSRKALSELINCRAGVSVEMACCGSRRHSIPPPRAGFGMQQQYDLALARKSVRLGKVRRLKAA